MASSSTTENAHCPINDLPELVLLQIFSSLSVEERSVLEETCKLWQNLVRNSPRLAFTCVVHLHALVEEPINPTPARLGRVLPRWTRQTRDQSRPVAAAIDPRPYGYIQQYLSRFRHEIKHLYIDVEQHDASCRYVLCRLLNLFGAEQCAEGRQVHSFRLRFIGHNPLLMQSQNITQALRTFFHYDGSKSRQQSLVSCDLSGLMISLDDDTILTLAKNHPYLRHLNLQDQSLVCILTPFCILQLTEMLPELEDLSIDMISLCDEFLLMLVGADDDQASRRKSPLKHLGIRIRREEKFSDEIDAQLWQKLRQTYPHLKMTLNFGITIPLHRMRVYMKPDLQLPVSPLSAAIDVMIDVSFRCTRWFSIPQFPWLKSFAWLRTVLERLWSMFMSVHQTNGRTSREQQASIKRWSIWRWSVPICGHSTLMLLCKKTPSNKSFTYILIWKSRAPVNFCSTILQHTSSSPKIWTISSVKWTRQASLYDMYSVYFLWKLFANAWTSYHSRFNQSGKYHQRSSISTSTVRRGGKTSRTFSNSNSKWKEAVPFLPVSLFAR